MVTLETQYKAFMEEIEIVVAHGMRDEYAGRQVKTGSYLVSVHKLTLINKAEAKKYYTGGRRFYSENVRKAMLGGRTIDRWNIWKENL